MNKQISGETIIAQGVRLEGDFVSQGDVIIEGEINGNLSTSGDLRVSETSIMTSVITLLFFFQTTMVPLYLLFS